MAMTRNVHILQEESSSSGYPLSAFLGTVKKLNLIFLLNGSYDIVPLSVPVVHGEIYPAKSFIRHYLPFLVDVLTFSPVEVAVALIRLTIISTVSNGLPRQFLLIKANIRCSILFHLLVPGGKWDTWIVKPVSFAKL